MLISKAQLIKNCYWETDISIIKCLHKIIKEANMKGIRPSKSNDRELRAKDNPKQYANSSDVSRPDDIKRSDRVKLYRKKVEEEQELFD